MAIGIYMAGKIAPHDWRHGIADVGVYEDNHVPDDYGPLETSLKGPRMPDGKAMKINYVGPFFVGCDHGCAHAGDGHGQVGGCVTEGDRQRTARNCLAQIRSADIVFAWLDELRPEATHSSAYGTLVEIGYAIGVGKPVVVAASRVPHTPGFDVTAASRHTIDDLWFAWTLASHRIVAETPQVAVERIARDMFAYAPIASF